MNVVKNRTAIMVVIAALWLVIMYLGWQNIFVPAMVLGVVLMYLHMLLGTAHGSAVDKKFLFYPLTVWAILWVISFILSGVLATKYAGVMPDKLFLGVDPSFAPTVFLYWLGGQLTLNLGLYLYPDGWLTQKQWDDFKSSVKEMEAQ